MHVYRHKQQTNSYFSTSKVHYYIFDVYMLSAFTIKGTKDYVYMHKILHPHDFEK